MVTAAAFIHTAETGRTGAEHDRLRGELRQQPDQLQQRQDRCLNTGLGSLVDADLAKESAQLQALQIRQQLGTQALSMANQAPQTLLSLFK